MKINAVAIAVPGRMFQNNPLLTETCIRQLPWPGQAGTTHSLHMASNCDTATDVELCYVWCVNGKTWNQNMVICTYVLV